MYRQYNQQQLKVETLKEKLFTLSRQVGECM